MLSFTVRALLSLALSFVANCAPQRVYERATFIKDTNGLLPVYDYVIIGGGTSGLTVADRLTEDDHSTTVLVIEYGEVDAQDEGAAVPGLPPPEKYMRNYQSVPQEGLNGRSSPVYTGAVVGGGTVVNAMFFNRGSKVDYDSWVELGNPGWGWDDLLPYFKKATTFTPPPADLKEQYPMSDDLTPHGTTGPVEAGFSVFQYDVIKNYFKGWNQIGVPSNPQPNDGFTNGAIYSTISLNFKNQSRSSSSTAHYLPLVGKRPNYHLITDQSVTKVSFSKKSSRVDGVHFTPRAGGAESRITAKKEYILAAGAVQSPKILQLSGIGPKKLLQGLGIRPLLDLPVGYNFQDQPSMFISLKYTTFSGLSPDTLSKDKRYEAEQLDLYLKNRTGALTLPYLGGSVVTFLDLPSVTGEYEKLINDAWAVDLSKVSPPGVGQPHLKGYRKQAKIILDLYRDPAATVQETAFGGGTTVPIAIMKPLSRGSILINTTDPTQPPAIDYQTFAHPADLAVAVAALKKNREFFDSPALKDELGALEVNPGLNITSNEDLAEAIRGLATSTWSHPVGTIPMMRKDYGGVVDPQLRVYGTKNLRVIDASIFPIIPATHTSWPVYAVAEKAADLIKQSRYEGRHY